jgi:hypothetical protein
MIHTRRLLARTDDGAYAGSIAIWGFSYEVEFRRVGDAVEVIVFDGAEPVGAYRQPAIDGEEPRDPDEVLASVTYHPADGEAV